MKWAKRTAVILALALAGCHSPPPGIPPAAETVALRLLSTTATAPLLHDLTEAYQQEHAELHFAFRVRSGDYARMIDLLNNTPPEEASYFLTNYLPPETALWAAPIGYDPIAIVVHPENPVVELSLEQLEQIFQGQLADWSAVGGENLPITVVSRETGSGTRLALEATLPASRRVTPGARLAFSSEAVIRIVGQERGAVGYVSAGLLDARVRPVAVAGMLPSPLLTAYPHQSPLLIVGRHEPEGDYRALIAWMQGPVGQAIVARRCLPLAR
jgi:phosphate transport system substrate-binding protein